MTKNIRNFYKNTILELTQENEVVNEILLKIAKGNRLMSDHRELLESTDIDVNEKKNDLNLFGLPSALILTGATILQVKLVATEWSTLKLVSAVTAGLCGVCFVVKTSNQLLNRLLVQRFDEIFQVINEVDLAIKRARDYLGEIKVLKSGTQHDNDEICRSCISSIIEILKILYEITKALEQTDLPPSIGKKYEHLGNIDECWWFSREINACTAADINKFYRYFLYFQSQLLMRLCLSLWYNKDAGIDFINSNAFRITKDLKMYTEIIMEPMQFSSNDLDVQRQAELRKSLRPVQMVILKQLKSESLTLASRLFAIAKECHDIDNAIQVITVDMIESTTPSTKLEPVLNSMKLIEHSLGSCFIDFQRLSLICNKVREINSSHTTSYSINETPITCPNQIENETVNHQQMKVDENFPQQDSDFFAYRNPKNDEPLKFQSSTKEEQSSIDPDEELIALDRIKTKKQFTTVLNQLKTVLDPIDNNIKEREKQYFLSKGIHFTLGDSDSDSDSDGSEVQASTSSQSKYNEMRTLLAGKNQLNLMPLYGPLIKTPSSQEDILE